MSIDNYDTRYKIQYYDLLRLGQDGRSDPSIYQFEQSLHFDFGSIEDQSDSNRSRTAHACSDAESSILAQRGF